MIRVKGTVKPKSLFIMAACANAGQILGLDILITSGNDSKHMMKSKHYSDNALDVRSKDFPNLTMKHSFLSLVLHRLGDKYQGILEHEGRPNEHFHFEYDPK